MSGYANSNKALEVSIDRHLSPKLLPQHSSTQHNNVSVAHRMLRAPEGIIVLSSWSSEQREYTL